MSKINKIQLKTSCILTVPLQNYQKDFSFIVNGEEFQTSVLISELLSPKISEIHKIDPTIDTYIINTDEKGDFSHILNLINFKETLIPANEFPFLTEVIEILGNESIDIGIGEGIDEMSVDNIIARFKYHLRDQKIYSTILDRELEFICSHFSDLMSTRFEELKDLGAESLSMILNDDHLELKDEDELLKFINDLYKEDENFGILYGSVYFVNVSGKSMRRFIEIYDASGIDGSTWTRLSARLSSEIKEGNENNENESESESERERMNKRYKKKNECRKRGLKIDKKDNEDFSGIVRYLRDQSSNKIENEINFTSSPVVNGDCYQPVNVSLFDDRNKIFESEDRPDSWICLDFKSHRVIPTAYTIRSSNWGGQNWCHPRSWVVEGSTDNTSWVTLDTQRGCSHLNGSGLVHTFKVNNETSKEFKYIRMKSTGKNWYNNNYLIIDSFEIYGTLI